MDFLYGPIEEKEPDGFEPLEWDDDECEEDDYVFYDERPVEEDEDEYEEPGLPGFDDLMPFGSFDSGYGWEDGYL